MQRPHGFVILQEVTRIWRATSVQGFEGQSSKFKLYAPFYRKPGVHLKTVGIHENTGTGQLWLHKEIRDIYRYRGIFSGGILSTDSFKTVHL